MPIIRAYRAKDADGDAPAEAGQGVPMVFTAATGGRKGDGIDLAGLPWDFSRAVKADDGAMQYPFLWVHDIQGRNLPLGVADVVTGDDPLPLRVAVRFDPDDPFAVSVERKYRSPVGGMQAVSIQWDDMDADGQPARASGKKAAAHQLWEVSAVPVGMDPEALQDGARAAMRALYDDLGAMLDGRDAGGRVGDKGRMVLSAEWVSRIRELPESGMGYHDVMVLCHGLPDFEARVLNCETLLVPSDVEGFSEDCIVAINAIEKHTVPDADTAEAQPERLAAEMVAIYEAHRWADDADAERRAAYNALLPRYRRAGWTAPEFVPMADLCALDDGTWRGLWLAGELQRVGAELSTKNVSELREIDAVLRDASKRLGAMLTRVTTAKEPPADDAADGGERALTIEDLAAAYARLVNKELTNG